MQNQNNKYEKALKESEGRFQKIFEHAPIAMAVVGIKGAIESINRKAVKVFGYLSKDIPTMDRWWMQAYPDEAYRKEVIADWTGRVQKAMTEGIEIIGNEYRVTCKDSAIKTMFISGVPVANKIFVMFDDITDRKQAEDALKESEEKFRNVFDNSAVGKSITNIAGSMNANTALCQMLGYTKEEFSQRKWQSITHPDDIELSQKYLDQLNFGKEKSVRFMKRYIKKDGSIIWAEGNIVLQKDNEGNPLYYITELVDITDRKQSEEALHESEEKFSKIFAAGLISISLSGFDNGKYVAVNDEFLRLSERTREEVIGHTPFDFALFVHPENHANIIATINKDGAIANREIEIRSKSGKILNMLHSAQSLVIHGKKYLLSMAVDITERKQAEEAIRKAQRQIAEVLSFNRMILESSPVGMLVYKASGECVSVNLAATRIIGGTTEQLLAQNFRSLGTWKHAGLLEYADRALTSGKLVTGEIRSTSSFGKNAWFNISFAPFAIAGENHLLLLYMATYIMQHK